MPLVLFKPAGIERADSGRQLRLPCPFCGVPLCPAHSSHQAPLGPGHSPWLHRADVGKILDCAHLALRGSREL